MSGGTGYGWRLGSHRWPVVVHFMKIRATSYVSAIATVALVLFLVWAGHVTWHELRQLHRSFEAVQEDAFHLSEHVASSFDDISDIALRFDPRGHPEDRLEFQKQSQDLRQWIRAHQSTTAMPQENELMDQIATAFELYVSQTTEWMNQRTEQRAGVLPAPALERTDKNAAPILDLCEQLKTVEHASQAQFLKDSQGALVWLQELLAVQMGLLVDRKSVV